MNRSTFPRRDVLRAGAALGAAPFWLRGMESAARERDRIVVCLELNGGNDGLNTVAPVADDLYQRARPNLAVGPKDGHALDDHHRWHPSLGRISRRFADGGVAVVQGVGYPDSNLSHFTSLDVWHSGTRTWPAPPTGWIGRIADATDGKERDPLAMLAIGADVAPHAMRSARGTAVAIPSLAEATVPTAPPDAPATEAEARRAVLERLERASIERGAGRDARIARAARDARQVVRDVQRTRSFEPRAKWPGGPLARDLNLVARVIAEGLPTRFFHVAQFGYDTHAVQAGPHARLLAELDAALDAFLSELEARDQLDRVLVVTISDFGRRVAQNGRNRDAGTDHGAASVQMLFGGGIEPGLHGPPPDLDALDANGNVPHRVDFREVYASVRTRWLGLRAEDDVDRGHRPHSCVRG